MSSIEGAKGSVVLPMTSERVQAIRDPNRTRLTSVGRQAGDTENLDKSVEERENCRNRQRFYKRTRLIGLFIVELNR